MSTLRENEDFFTAQLSSIRSDAPIGASVVVVDNAAVVGYFDDLESAARAWAELDGAILKPLADAPARLVASNYLRHQHS